ncbi:hypothetical protein Hanom_Chr11g01064771 [Helianthus anomalus]
MHALHHLYHVTPQTNLQCFTLKLNIIYYFSIKIRLQDQLYYELKQIVFTLQLTFSN